MLKRKQFAVLSYLAQNKKVSSQRDISAAVDYSVGTVNSVMQDLVECGYVDDDGVTRAGHEALEPYKVKNAVIMAAGLSSRFAPISYEQPKGLLRVRGEVLIERQIQQLKEAGITDITIVVGYMKELFFYLEDKYEVKIVVNEHYSERNNNYSLYLVRDSLSNTYICSSDDYFVSNVFEPYVYEAYYPGVFVEGYTSEYCMKTKGNRRRKIKKVTVSGNDAWVMLGHAYWDRPFSRKFSEILEKELNEPETLSKLWEDIYIDHIDQLNMVMRQYDDNTIFEFDSLDELCNFDSEFIDNVDSEIFANICSVLNCSAREITSITPIKQGLTNLSFSFVVGQDKYVYRHPGFGTEEIINRESEAFSQKVAKQLGLDDTFIFESPENGWKISRFIDNCIPFDYHNPEHVRKGLELGRRLHNSGAQSSWDFDIYGEALKMIKMISKTSRTKFADFAAIQERIERLNDFVHEDGVEPCLCHNDFYDPNFLVNEECFYLIDWEYSGMSDYASDLGTFICCSDYTKDEVADTLAIYFDREPTREEERHCLAYVAISGFYWFVWAIYQEVCGNSVGEYLYLWYKYAKKYGKRALALYQD